MIFFKFKPIWFFIIFCTYFAKEDALFNNIYQLEEFDFDVMVKNGANQNWFIMFYTSWCPHCKRLLPIFDELALNLNQKIHFGVVDWYFKHFPLLK